MKNLIPYNLFEMAKLNIQDYIKDIEQIRDSVDYFNSKYKEIELNDKILNVDFKLPSNNGLSPRLYGIAVETDNMDYSIIRLICFINKIWNKYKLYFLIILFKIIQYILTSMFY